MSEIRGLEAFDEVKRLIVVAAHPDDMETMCGGTIALLVQRGIKVFVANCTLGDIGAQEAVISRPALAVTRLEETEEAARILGLEDSFNLGQPDGELVSSLELRAQIARLYRHTGADTLWTFDPFWAGQIHPDHRAAGLTGLDAYMPSKMPLYRPEQLSEPGACPGCLERVFFFSTTREPDIVIDISQVYDTKMAACMAHRSQFPQGEESLQWMKDMDQQHGQAIGASYAEVFKQIEVW
jgi:LmbE family N-acetylglucosaminyl deacetylase